MGKEVISIWDFVYRVGYSIKFKVCKSFHQFTHRENQLNMCYIQSTLIQLNLYFIQSNFVTSTYHWPHICLPAIYCNRADRLQNCDCNLISIGDIVTQAVPSLIAFLACLLFLDSLLFSAGYFVICLLCTTIERGVRLCCVSFGSPVSLTDIHHQTLRTHTVDRVFHLPDRCECEYLLNIQCLSNQFYNFKRHKLQIKCNYLT